MDVQARYRELVEAQDVIGRTLEELKAIVRNEKTSKAKAAFLYGVMAQYVLRQDEDFYATLNKRHEKNPSALKILDFFAEDLKYFKVKLFIFEEKYLAGRLDNGRKWIADVGELSQEITARLHMEQSQLLPLLLSGGSSVDS